MTNCPKCFAFSGDKWLYCQGACPIVGSPYYRPDALAKSDAEEPARYSPEPMEGEPHFTLLARDPGAPALIRQWVRGRRQAAIEGEWNPDELRVAQQADEIADEMEEWRKVHEGEWRLIPPEENHGRRQYANPDA